METFRLLILSIAVSNVNKINVFLCSVVQKLKHITHAHICMTFKIQN